MRERLALGLILLFGSSLLAQTGNLDPTPFEAAKLPTFVPQAVELIEEKVVDLRPWMPPVGEQQMNDCTTWAIGYGLKSYFEAREQGWRPDSPGRIFSPRFLYNQINNGQDKGSNYIRAIQIMQSQGIATLASEPYIAGDFKGQPKAVSKEEAAVFPVLDGLRITSRVGIRRALQRRQAVAFGAIVCPIFLSGKFDIYGPGDFSRGLKLKQPGQPHGRHAMVIVGYDDGRGAFLVQNSWGTRWNNAGYCWVKYELFDTIRPAKDEEGVFCLWAATLLDIEEPVERDASGHWHTKPLDLKTLSARGFADITRYDEKVGKYRYVFNADLRGQREAIAKVDSVAWTWEDDTGQKHTSTSRDAETQFSVMGASYTNPIKLRGVAKLKDGTEKFLGDADIPGPTPKAEFRDATVVFRDQYQGRVQGNTPWWQWGVTLDVPLNDVENIAKVEWNVGKWNQREPIQTLTGFNGPPATERAIGFAGENQGEITGTITYRDGGVKTVKTTPKITDPVRDEPTIEVSAREINADAAGNTYYAWTLTIDRPREQDTKIKHVEYVLDPWLANPNRTEIQVYKDYATSGISHRDFRVTGTVVYDDGRPPVKLERWVELGPKSKFAGGDRFELYATDAYTGRIAGRPYWTTTWRLIGDRQQIQQLANVRQKFLTRESNAVNPAETGYAYAMNLEAGGGKIVYTFDGPDGKPRTLENEHKPAAPANDALRVAVNMSDRADYSIAWMRHAYTYAATLVGPNDFGNTIQQVDYRYRVRGRAERTIVNPQMMYWPWQLHFESATDEAFDLEAVATHMDGFRERLVTPVKPGFSVEPKPDLSLRIREAFNGYDDKSGAPEWVSLFEVVGDAAVTDQIARVDYELKGYRIVDTHKTTAEKNATKRVLFFGPSQLKATVTMADGSTRELAGELLADAPRTKEPIELRAVRDARVADGKGWIVFLAGWESKLKHVQFVNYYAKDKSFEYGVPDRQLKSSELANFALVHTSPGSCPLRVQVGMDDGTDLELSIDPHIATRPLDWTSAHRYWGDGLWETDLWLTGEPNDLSDIRLYSDFIADPPNKYEVSRVPVWPTQYARVHWPGGVQRIKEFSYGTAKERVLRLPGRAVQVGGGAVRETLGYQVLRQPGQPEAATAKEWVVSLIGPEKELSRVKSVTYTVGEESFPAPRRWGEATDGFERHLVYTEKPDPTVVVTFEDGTTKTVE